MFAYLYESASLELVVVERVEDTVHWHQLARSEAGHLWDRLHKGRDHFSKVTVHRHHEAGHLGRVTDR